MHLPVLIVLVSSLITTTYALHAAPMKVAHEAAAPRLKFPALKSIPPHTTTTTHPVIHTTTIHTTTLVTKMKAAASACTPVSVCVDAVTCGQRYGG